MKFFYFSLIYLIFMFIAASFVNSTGSFYEGGPVVRKRMVSSLLDFFKKAYNKQISTTTTTTTTIATTASSSSIEKFMKNLDMEMLKKLLYDSQMLRKKGVLSYEQAYTILLNDRVRDQISK